MKVVPLGTRFTDLSHEEEKKTSGGSFFQTLRRKSRDDCEGNGSWREVEDIDLRKTTRSSISSIPVRRSDR
jgi:hypothetical protein